MTRCAEEVWWFVSLYLSGAVCFRLGLATAAIATGLHGRIDEAVE